MGRLVFEVNLTILSNCLFPKVVIMILVQTLRMSCRGKPISIVFLHFLTTNIFLEGLFVKVAYLSVWCIPGNVTEHFKQMSILTEGSTDFFFFIKGLKSTFIEHNKSRAPEQCWDGQSGIKCDLLSFLFIIIISISSSIAVFFRNNDK